MVLSPEVELKWKFNIALLEQWWKPKAIKQLPFGDHLYHPCRVGWLLGWFILGFTTIKHPKMVCYTWKCNEKCEIIHRKCQNFGPTISNHLWTGWSTSCFCHSCFRLIYENGGFLTWASPKSFISIGFSIIETPIWNPQLKQNFITFFYGKR